MIDKVVLQITYSGTHENKFMEHDPTGNSFKYKGIFIFQLTDMKISRVWEVEDEVTMMRQLRLKIE